MIKKLVFLEEHTEIWALVIRVNSVMGPFTDTVGTTTLLTAFDERGITYLVAINAGWMPYLADEGVWFVHYLANKVRRQVRLD